MESFWAKLPADWVKCRKEQKMYKITTSWGVVLDELSLKSYELMARPVRGCPGRRELV